MRSRILTWILLFFGLYLNAQRGKNNDAIITATGSIVNEYARLTADVNAGSTTITSSSITLNDNNRFTSALSAGDLLLIIQMQGAQINASDEPNFGAITQYNNSGNYEWAEVKSVSFPSTIELSCGLQNSYSSWGNTQIIRVPRYRQLTVNGSGNITAPQWNGQTGGVVVIETDKALNLNSTNAIDVSGKGFRGGADPTPSLGQFGVLNFANSNNEYGAEKGESIAGSQSDYANWGFPFCKGAPANGGGGGNAHNAGGGGGANAGNPALYTGNGNPDISNTSWITAWNLESANFANSTSSGGGRGGYTFSSGNINALTLPPGNPSNGGDYRRNNGGLGGKPLLYSGQRVFMGGGGGAGEENGDDGGNGGNGGGIVLIRSFDVINGSGFIRANGANGGNTTPGFLSGGNDGAGGAGGGGAVIVNSSLSISGISIEAKGGNGGNQDLPVNITEGEGPGGGGGGGYVSLSNSLPNVNVNGGANGTTDGSSLTEFPPNGATKGGNGQINIATALPELIASSDTACLGSSVELIVLSGATPNTFFWGSAVMNNDLGNSDSLTYFPSQTNETIYLSSCALRQSVSVPVTSELPPSVDAGIPQSICIGDNIQLVGTSSTSNVSWEPANLVVDATNITTQANTNQTTMFYLTATSAAGCTNSDSVTVTLLPAVLLTVSANADSLCQGETLTVNAQTSGTVSWEADFDLTNIDNLNIIGTPSVSGWIVANASAVGSCAVSDSIEVTVLELPQVNAGANLQTCAGVAVQLNGSASGNFAWIANPTLSATDVLNPTVNTLTDAVYYLQASTPFGCIASDSVQVEISGSVQADAGNDTTICSGTLLTLNASGGNTYSWNNAMLLNDSGIANPVATITNNTEFVVSVSLNGACEATDTVRVNVFEITIPSLSEGGIACGAPGIELGITGVASAQWNPSLGVLDPNALSTFANPNDSTFYTANYIDFNGCNGVSSPILVVPGESAQSGFSWEQISNFVVVFESTNAQPGQTVSWLINNQVITGDSVAFNFPFESEWTVTQIVENTCGSDTLTELIEVVKLAGYDALGVQPLEIFPNPAVNFVKIILSDQAEDASNLTVYSSTGAVVAVLEQLPSESIVLPVENWDSGVYEIRYTSRNTIKSARFIKQ
jgi:hypothetical protein